MTSTPLVTEIPARTRIHRCDELKCGRVVRLQGRAGNGYFAGFKRLAERFEDTPVKLGELIQKQYAVVRKADFTGPCTSTTTDQSSSGGGMVGRAKRPATERARVESTGADRGDGGNFERLGLCQWRQQRRQSPCQRAFPGPGNANQQQAVAAGGCDEQRAFGKNLTANVAELEIITRLGDSRRRGAGGLGSRGRIDVPVSS